MNGANSYFYLPIGEQYHHNYMGIPTSSCQQQTNGVSIAQQQNSSSFTSNDGIEQPSSSSSHHTLGVIAHQAMPSSSPHISSVEEGMEKQNSCSIIIVGGREDGGTSSCCSLADVCGLEEGNSPSLDVGGGLDEQNSSSSSEEEEEDHGAEDANYFANVAAVEKNNKNNSKFYVYSGLSEPEYTNILQYFASKAYPSFVKTKNERRSFRRTAERFQVLNGELFFKRRRALKKVLKVDDVLVVVKEAHERLSHAGVSRTLGEVSKRYYFKKMRTDIAHFIASCPECKKRWQKAGEFDGEDESIQEPKWHHDKSAIMDQTLKETLPNATADHPESDCPKGILPDSKSGQTAMITTTKSKEMLVHDGFQYIRNHSHKEVTYWQCKHYKTAQKCRGRAKTTTTITTAAKDDEDDGEEEEQEESTTIVVTREHSCVPSPTSIEVASIRSNIRRQAIRTKKSPRAVVNECIAGASEAAIATLPKLISLDQNVLRKRKRRDLLSIPRNRQEIVFPEEFRRTRTELAEEFVLYDSGPEVADRLIILGSLTELNRLAICETWFADGSYRTSADNFYQLWTILGLYRDRVVPFIFCLLPNKSKEMYQIALGAILDRISLDLRPTQFLIDFEKSAELAIRNLLPMTHIRGNWFHFNQSLWRSIERQSLSVRYSQDCAYAFAIKNFAALAFCDVADVRQRFVNLGERFLQRYGTDQNHLDFLDYMENNWVGRPFRTPLFPIEMWNARSITEIQCPCTKNSIGSWHYSLQAVYGRFQRNFFRFMDGILRENAKANELCLKLDTGEEVPLYSRKENRQANLRLMEIIADYQNCDEVEFLEKCTHHFHFV